MKKILKWCISLLIIILICGTSYIYFNNKNKSNGDNQSSNEESNEKDTRGSSTEPNEDITTGIPSEQVLAKEKITGILNEMSLEEKIGQLFLARVPVENQLEDIKNYFLGGYLLFGRDFENKTLEQVKQSISRYQEYSSIPMLIASDEEGGTVTRISSLLETSFKSPQELYKTGGIELVKEDIKNKSKLLKDYGIHTGLFPDADVATKESAFIYQRTLGLDAKTTAEYISQVVKVLKEEQFGSTLKHFPGYGNNVDSHVDIVIDNRSLEELRKVDFLPFIAGIEAGADSILVAHNIVTSIDGNVPASISPEVHKIIREELNFKGVIMTDDLDMEGISSFISQEEAGVKAIEAGNDLILSSTYKTQIPYIIDSVKSGRITEERINESVMRILEWKNKLGIL
ncbi:MAG: beta-hexosaminidase [Clostridium sulfidigenes]|uniref:Beta-hexosaminidase n=1 Tax=Clostridium sulfidigenes TaxID=318464 RepID=A0A927ZJG9_9CLOT|nr:beta-hexosaminidase [Clostridium sulfidigenes]